MVVAPKAGDVRDLPDPEPATPSVVTSERLGTGLTLFGEADG